MVKVPRNAKYEKGLKVGAIDSAAIAANAVTYAKLDEKGRSYKLVIRREATDVAATDFDMPIGIADAGKVKSVKMVGVTGIGQATNYAIVDVINKKGDATGTASVATMTFDNATTHALTAFIPKDLTVQTGTSGDIIAAGDVLSLKKTHAGTGQALPASFIIEIIIERSA